MEDGNRSRTGRRGHMYSPTGRPPDPGRAGGGPALLLRGRGVAGAALGRVGRGMWGVGKAIPQSRDHASRGGRGGYDRGEGLGIRGEGKAIPQSRDHASRGGRGVGLGVWERHGPGWSRPPRYSGRALAPHPTSHSPALSCSSVRPLPPTPRRAAWWLSLLSAVRGPAL